MSDQEATIDEVAKQLCKVKGWRYLGFAGGGTFKRVYKAEDASHAILAAKVLKDQSPRTEREVEILKRCNHAHIAKLYEAGKIRLNGTEYDYTVEEFLGGGTLAEKVGVRLLDREAVYSIGLAMIDALCHLHPNIVHRDIKPANIMFRTDGTTPVLVDFGLVRCLDSASLTQSWLSRGPGTPMFAPPEQLNNAEHMIDWRADQFSLGVSLALCHFGIHPYQYPNEPEVTEHAIARVGNRMPPRADFKQLVAKARLSCLHRMIQRWPVERFRTPLELLIAWKNEK